MSATNNQPDKTYTVLYIEDDPANRTLVQFIFETRDDISLIEADTGYGGIEMACSQNPDIIILDLSLPDLSGFDVLKKLQSEPAVSAVPVIALTGDSLPQDRAKGLEAGFFSYMTKPIDVKTFYSVIDSAKSAIANNR